MSRLTIIASLFLSLSSVASADRVFEPNPEPHAFAQPPDAPVMQPPERAINRDDLRAALARMRAANLDAFRAYEKKGVFPSNTYTDGELNVWRDADGHLCAAATMIDGSQHALVMRTAEQTNFIQLKDVSQGPLMDWILTSGLTKDEVVLIQRPFRPVARPQIAPEQPTVVDAHKRAVETARLRTKYAAIEKQIVANDKKSLDLATDRLMKHPDLAWKVLHTRG
jgi:hypothetical protein